MKLDYTFIKEILLTMENYDKHEIENLELMKMLNITAENEDKFIGHIFVIGDNGFIDYSHNNYPYGFAKISGCEGYQIINDEYRITAQGYEFLDVLKNDNVFNKIKNFAFSNALDIGKQILIKYTLDNIL